MDLPLAESGGGERIAAERAALKPPLKARFPELHGSALLLCSTRALD